MQNIKLQLKGNQANRMTQQNSMKFLQAERSASLKENEEKEKTQHPKGEETIKLTSQITCKPSQTQIKQPT